MLRLNCFIQTDAEHRDDVIASAKALTAESLKEDGCIAYDIFTSATRPDVMMICETWQNEDALAKHSASEHFAKYVGHMKSIASLKLEKFTF